MARGMSVGAPQWRACARLARPRRLALLGAPSAPSDWGLIRSGLPKGHVSACPALIAVRYWQFLRDDPMPRCRDPQGSGGGSEYRPRIFLAHHSIYQVHLRVFSKCLYSQICAMKLLGYFARQFWQ